MSATWSYNGSTTVSVTIDDAVNGDKYMLACDDPSSSTTTVTATGTSVTVSVTDVGGSGGFTFGTFLYHGNSSSVSSSSPTVYVNVFTIGTADTHGTVYAATWAYDGTTGVSVTFTAAGGVTYRLRAQATGGSPGVTGGPYTAGTSHTITLTLSGTPTGKFWGLLYDDGGANPEFTDRVFLGGSASAGLNGNPAVSAVTHTAHGVCVAFGSDALDATPTYTSIDDPDAIDVVTGWRTKRGRTYMTDRTEAGTAEVEFVDTAGTMDPTNSGGPFYPMDPNCPLRIELFHPIDEVWHTIYTGLVQNMPQTLDVSEKFIHGTVNAADLFSLLAIDEVPPGLDFDDTAAGTSTANTVGETTYAAADAQDRLKAIAADAGVDPAQTNFFTLNVNVQFTIYPPGTSILSVAQDTVDAEFPGVANMFIAKDGVWTAHGRKARFDPTNPDYGINTWDVGDTAAVLANPTWAVISGLEFDRDVAKVINAALVSPDGIDNPSTVPGVSDLPGQLSFDAGSITQYGNRVYTAANLITLEGKTDGRNANAETKLFADYFTSNFHDPQNRISQITIRSVPETNSYAGPVWDILCGVEISDVVNVTTTHPGGGGFSAAPYFVEGISYEASVLGGDNFQDVTMKLDLSPAAYFADVSHLDGS